MEYFRISQDKRYLHPPIITNIRDIIKRRSDAAAGKGEQVADANVAFIAPQPETDFPDILDAQVFLVSDRMKEVFRMYEPSLRFKMVCVLDNIRGAYANYHIPLFPEADCLSPESVVLPDKSAVRELVLCKERIGPGRIFRVAGLRTDAAVIRMDVLESLLRRGIRDFRFSRVRMA